MRELMGRVDEVHKGLLLEAIDKDARNIYTMTEEPDYFEDWLQELPIRQFVRKYGGKFKSKFVNDDYDYTITNASGKKLEFNSTEDGEWVLSELSKLFGKQIIVMELDSIPDSHKGISLGSSTYVVFPGLTGGDSYNTLCDDDGDDDDGDDDDGFDEEKSRAWVAKLNKQAQQVAKQILKDGQLSPVKTLSLDADMCRFAFPNDVMLAIEVGDEIGELYISSGSRFGLLHTTNRIPKEQKKSRDTLQDMAKRLSKSSLITSVTPNRDDNVYNIRLNKKAVKQLGGQNNA